MFLRKRALPIFLILSLVACASREYGATSLLAPRTARSVYSIKPVAAVWMDAVLLRVIGSDTFHVRLAEGQGDETVSLFGVRSVSSLDPNLHANQIRQQTLDSVMPGDSVAVEPVSRTDTGKLLVIIKTEAGESLALSLAKRGLVVPSVVCRKIDVCTPAVLSLLGLEAVARACELAFTGNRALALALATDGDQGQEGSPAWVADVVSHAFVPYTERDRIPFCRRVLFPDRSMSAFQVEKLGFKQMRSE